MSLQQSVNYYNIAKFKISKNNVT